MHKLRLIFRLQATCDYYLG